MRYEELEPEYTQDLLHMTLTATHRAAVEAKQYLLPHKDRFLEVEKRTGVPALWLMPVWYREKPSFNAYFGNGDALDRPTTHVPRNRGPFQSWEDGVVDSLALDHISVPKAWTWALACYEWELWNGFGPRNHGRASGYVWSGTSVYQGGKYVADGVWSRGTYDSQLGCVALAKAINALDDSIRLP
jgi:lysozyme family protein